MKISGKSGFTIIELLIVIVIIAILAAITLVAYSTIQSRATDSAMRQGSEQFAKALQLWAVDNGNSLKGDSGSTTAISGGFCADGNGAGFVASGVYTCTIEDELVAAGRLPSGFMRSLPKNTYYAGSTAGQGIGIMLYPCSSQPGQYALYWTLLSPTSDDTNSINSVLTTCQNSTSIQSSWGMRAARILQL